VACTETGHYTPATEATANKQSASSGKYISGIKLDSKKHIVGIDTANLPTVNNGTYTVKTKVGSTTTSVSDFTANQSSADDITFIQGTNVILTSDTTNRTITVSSSYSDTKVTSAANHYAPEEDTNAAISANSTSSTNITGTSGKLNVVTGLKRDSKGHIVGVTSANIYSTDADTNTAHSHSAGTGLTISGSGGTSGTTTYSAKLRDTTALTIDSVAATTTTNRVYPVAVDKTGYLAVNVPWTDNDTKYSAGSGLTLNGTTFNHSNSVEGAAVCNATATSGKTITIPHFTFDNQGHITLAGTRTHTVSGFTNNSGTVTSITPGTGLTGASSDAAITTSGTINLKTASVAGTTGAEIGGIKVAKDNSSYSVATNTSSISANVTSGKYYGVEIDKDDKAFVYVPWTDTNTTSFTITANATDDDVVVLSGTNGTNATTYTASHAKTFGNTTAPYTAKYTSGNSTTSISGYGDSKTIKIPQITVDEYGHVRAGTDESVTITMPSAQTIPTLSGGSAAETGKYVSGVTVSGHTVTVSKAALPTTLKNPTSLTFGSKTYDGSEAKTITAADLGLGQAMRYIGKTSTSLSESTTSNTITIDSKSVTAQQGDVVIDKNNKKEYI
jgi:hypothetical protein